MLKLFEPFKINQMQVANRFVRSATVDNQGKDGIVTELQLSRYRELARGEIGLIVSSGLFPNRDGWAAPGQLGIHRNEMIPSLQKLVAAVHQNGGKIVAQLMHGGWFSDPKISGMPVVGPTAMVNPANGLTVRELSSDEVYEYIEQFVLAGRRAVEAGFDAIQLHAAHSWFLSAFLSPVTNKRLDEWGGSRENRAKIAVSIVQGLRKMAGPDYPILIKLGLKEYHSEGRSLEESIQIAKLLEEAGIDAIEVSEGIEEQPFHHIRLNARQPYYVEECRQVKQAVKIPVILVGGMRKFQEMEQTVQGETADAVSLCRPFIMDPYIIKKFRAGAKFASDCTSCNRCILEMHKGNIHCVLI